LQKRAFWAGKGRVQEITPKFVGRIGKGDACLDVPAPVGGYCIRESPRSRLDCSLQFGEVFFHTFYFSILFFLFRQHC